jgi:type I restriction enzyme S subunit
MELKPGYKQTEVGIIPEDWDIVPVSKLGETKRGASSLCIKYRQSGGVRLIRINDFFEDKPVFVEPTAEIMRFALSERDLLFAGTGASAGASYLPKEEWLGLPHSYNAPRIRVFKDDSKEFLLYSLQSGYVLRQQRAWFVGNAQPFLDTKAISNFSIAVPKTSTEKCTIAEALSDVDALLGGVERLIVKKRDLKQAAMQQLLTGQTRLPGFRGEWEVKRLGDVVEIKKGELITEKDAIHGNIPVIAGGKKPSYLHNRANRSGKTITISGSGASAGYVSFFETPIFASDCSTISEGPRYAIQFIYFVLHLRQEEIYAAQTGGAQPHIHPNDLRPMSIRVPQVAEQTAIAATVSDMDAELAALEQRRDKTRALKEGMMQELLTGRTRLV